MKNSWWKIAVVIALVAVVAIVIANKNQSPKKTEVAAATSRESQEVTSTDTGTAVEPKAVISEKMVEKTDTKAHDTGIAATKKSQSGTKEKPAATESKATKPSAPSVKPAAEKPKVQPVAEKKLPKLLELGSTRCVPCKMMAPIIEELSNEYKEKLEIEFVDVWEHRDQAEKYGVESIPTQIFFDKDGKEVFRHVGFFPKDDIKAVLAEMGVK